MSNPGHADSVYFFTGKCCNLEMFFRTPYRNKINLMKKLLTGVSVAALFFLTQSVSAQTKTNTAVLRQASMVQAEKEKQLKVRLIKIKLTL